MSQSKYSLNNFTTAWPMLYIYICNKINQLIHNQNLHQIVHIYSYYSYSRFSLVSLNNMGALATFSKLATSSQSVKEGKRDN